MKLNISPIKGINQNDLPSVYFKFWHLPGRTSVFYQVWHSNKFDILKSSLNESEFKVAI